MVEKVKKIVLFCVLLLIIIAVAGCGGKQGVLKSKPVIQKSITPPVETQEPVIVDVIQNNDSVVVNDTSGVNKKINLERFDQSLIFDTVTYDFGRTDNPPTKYVLFNTSFSIKAVGYSDQNDAMSIQINEETFQGLKRGSVVELKDGTLFGVVAVVFPSCARIQNCNPYPYARFYLWKKDEFMFHCDSNEDCVSVLGDCCSCDDGGFNIPMGASYANSWSEKISNESYYETRDLRDCGKSQFCKGDIQLGSCYKKPTCTNKTCVLANDPETPPPSELDVGEEVAFIPNFHSEEYKRITIDQYTNMLWGHHEINESIIGRPIYFDGQVFVPPWYYGNAGTNAIILVDGDISGVLENEMLLHSFININCVVNNFKVEHCTDLEPFAKYAFFGYLVRLPPDPMNYGENIKLDLRAVKKLEEPERKYASLEPTRCHENLDCGWIAADCWEGYSWECLNKKAEEYFCKYGKSYAGGGEPTPGAPGTPCTCKAGKCAAG
jgi:hypothetical protein